MHWQKEMAVCVSPACLGRCLQVHRWSASHAKNCWLPNIQNGLTTFVKYAYFSYSWNHLWNLKSQASVEISGLWLWKWHFGPSCVEANKGFARGVLVRPFLHHLWMAKNHKHSRYFRHQFGGFWDLWSSSFGEGSQIWSKSCTDLTNDRPLVCFSKNRFMLQRAIVAKVRCWALLGSSGRPVRRRLCFLKKAFWTWLCLRWFAKKLFI